MNQELLIQPGEILQEEFLRPYGLDATALAGRLGLQPAMILDVVDGRAAIDGALSQLLGHAFGVSETFFAHIQTRYELDRASFEAASDEVAAGRLRRADALAVELLGS